MRLDGLYLPFELCDFGPEETRSYLARSGEQKNTQAFAELPQLVEAIDRVTHGLPLFLAIAVDAVVEPVSASDSCSQLILNGLNKRRSRAIAILMKRSAHTS